ncbi:MAG: hypothetical protein Q9190_002537 [Brigantiaea leucoxantha]
MVNSATPTSPDQHQQTEFAERKAVPATERRERSKNAATGASAAGARVFGSQVVAFYFRAPAKAFFQTRVDYLAFARAINPRVQANEAWSWRMSSPGILAHAVHKHGWSFIPNHVLPPLIANTSVGAILYTSYLQTLSLMHVPSSESKKRTYPPPPPSKTFAAGFVAGALQSVIAAPLDAMSVRFRPSDVLSGRYKSMWQYSRLQIKDIGVRGVFAGWIIVSSFGYALFFSTFEFVKAQSYYGFIARYYSQRPVAEAQAPVIIPHYAIEPAFLMAAGIAASVAQQVIQHPVSKIQDVYYKSLFSLDKKNSISHSRSQILRNYYNTYQTTYKRCHAQVVRNGGWRQWLFNGFFWNTIKQVPGTSAGLIIFELVRRRYGDDLEPVRIEKDGRNLLLV